MKPKIVLFTEKEKQLKEAKDFYGKNKMILEVLRERRKSEPLSYQAIVDKYKALDKDVKLSRANITGWGKTYSHLLTDNNLFQDFLVGIGLDQGTIDAEAKYKKDKKYFRNKSQIQKEKNDKLEDEMQKARVIIQEMNNPDLGDTKKWELASTSRRQVDAVNKAVAEGGLPKAGGVTELFNVNGKLLAKGKEIILEKVGTLNISHMSELKALSDILDTAFKQNRLIEGKSTDNVAVGVHDIYDKIIEVSDKQKLGQ